MSPDWVRFEKEEELKAEVERLKTEHERLKIDYQDALGSVRELENRRDELLAEVERLKKQKEKLWESINVHKDRTHKAEEDYERLKKDFVGQLKKAKRAGQYAFNNGLVEGERRAMERVEKAIDNQSSFGTIDTSLLRRELGLGEEEKR